AEAEVRVRPLPDPRSQAIRLHGVSYEYPGRAGLVLRDVDLDLAPGTMTALVGASGSGKSTIARLLLRFADPSGGTICCGASDMRELEVPLWREKVAWVPQHPTLFTGTLADNVRLGAPDASDDQVLAALRAAGAQGLITSLPDGLATVIGESARRISAGQRQRVAVARAFLRDAALLILDEPTAHLDQDTAESVGDAIERLARGRTTLLIVHDEALARRADQIFTIAAGPTGAAIALLATSGYLISRAAQRPMIISLMVTIVAIRAFGITRATLRYAERLASHDLALRQLARLRVRFFTALAPLVPGQLRGTSRGDRLARFVGDVDTLQDVYLRVLIPTLVALVVTLGATAAGWLMLGTVGLALLLALTVTAVLSSWASATVAAASGRTQAPARAALTGQLVEAIDGSAELALAGRAQERVTALGAIDARLARLGRRDALAGALASGLHSLLTGIGLLALLLVGIGGVRSGDMPGVLLAATAFLFLGACPGVA